MSSRTSVLLSSGLPWLCPAHKNGSACVKANTGRGSVPDGKDFDPATNFRVARTQPVAVDDHERVVPCSGTLITQTVKVEANKTDVVN
jgi:hypothetical protein